MEQLQPTNSSDAITVKSPGGPLCASVQQPLTRQRGYFQGVS